MSVATIPVECTEQQYREASGIGLGPHCDRCMRKGVMPLVPARFTILKARYIAPVHGTNLCRWCVYVDTENLCTELGIPPLALQVLLRKIN